MTRRWFLVAVGAAACTGNSHHDIVAPFEGAPHRFIVDAYQLPTNNVQAQRMGDDLNGDAVVDNQLGVAMGTLSGMMLTPPHPADLVASGAVASSVVILADDLTDDPHVGVTFYGFDGAPATTTGGTFVAGTFVSNRTRTTSALGAAIVPLPVIVDADPTPLQIEAMEIDLQPDGNGGYNALVRGAVGNLQPVYQSLFQMITNDPIGHRDAIRLFTFGDMLTVDTIAQNSLLMAWLAFDVTLLGYPMASIGFGVHLSPCPSGDCALTLASVVDHCDDRALDGDESDVDCGGSCHACIGGQMCRGGNECDSGMCSNGRCIAATCTDGVQDGLETGVDCGTNCGKACL
jgi:hypothetical protein